MTTRNVDYKVRTTGHRTAGALGAAGDPLVADFLQLLSRAARQFHTYPATSPLCADAIEASQKAFVSIDPGKPLVCRVTPGALIVDEVEVGRGTLIEQELARPLHRARVASLDIDRTASARDWTQFCGALLRSHHLSGSKTTFAELLTDAGVTAIIPYMTPRPEVLDLGSPPLPVRDLVARERARQATLPATGPVQYFYPPDKGWVMLDPGVKYDSVSLLDLTVLVDDPAQLASVLMRLTDDDEAGVPPEAALEQKYSDVVTLIGGLDPRLARVLFTRLARAVLNLDPDRRKALLKRSILPGLLDGRADGEAVLGEFPEVDLADALCLLLDLETAAPELLSIALNRLNLPADRRDAVVPLIQARLRGGLESGAADRRPESGLDRYAGALIRIESSPGQSFADFAAFDLSMNEQTTATLARAREAIGATDAIDAQLTCLASLAHLEPSPLLVDTFLCRALTLLGALAREKKWEQFAQWIARFGGLVAALREPRPEIAASIREALTRLCDRRLIVELAELSASGDEGRASAQAIVAALGPSLVPAWLAALESAADRPLVRPLTPALSERARDLAPAVARQLPRCGPEAARSAVNLLGFAGRGYEKVIADQLARGDEPLFREALHALARIGTGQAAAAVVEQLEHGPARALTAAEDALWRLPAAVALTKARELLGRREFVTSHPQLAGRLLDRTARTAGADLQPMLHNLARLRYHFWDPAVVRVATRARELMQ